MGKNKNKKKEVIEEEAVVTESVKADEVEVQKVIENSVTKEVVKVSVNTISIVDIVKKCNKVSKNKITEFSIMSYGVNNETMKIEVLLKNGNLITI